MITCGLVSDGSAEQACKSKSTLFRGRNRPTNNSVAFPRKSSGLSLGGQSGAGSVALNATNTLSAGMPSRIYWSAPRRLYAMMASRVLSRLSRSFMRNLAKSPSIGGAPSPQPTTFSFLFGVSTKSLGEYLDNAGWLPRPMHQADTFRASREDQPASKRIMENLDRADTGFSLPHTGCISVGRPDQSPRSREVSLRIHANLHRRTLPTYLKKLPGKMVSLVAVGPIDLGNDLPSCTQRFQVLIHHLVYSKRLFRPPPRSCPEAFLLLYHLVDRLD